MEKGDLIAIFGREPSLSLWELQKLLVEPEFKEISRELAIFAPSEAISINNVQKRAGGLIKLGEIKGEVEDLAELKHQLEKIWPNLIPAGSTARVNFGASAYDAGVSPDRKFRQELKRQMQAFKKYLTLNHRSARLVESKEPTLQAGALVQGKILKQGFEILVLLSEEKIYWGITKTVQDISNYGFRDFGRPSRDSFSGMLPPKVAQILINLTKAKPEETLLDPFCGSGTILQEASLIGIKNIIGSDLSQKAVIDSHKNIDWLKKSFPDISNCQFNVFESDVKNLSEKFQLGTIDVVVTEPYLGPPQKGRDMTGNIVPLVSALSRQYIPWLEILAKLIRPTGRIAMVWPFFKVEKHGYFLQIQESLPALGLKILPPPPEFIALPWFKSTPRGTVLYSRPDQVVGREIVLLAKNV
ncbi:MAG: hypothetical protein WCT08_03910 [Patescibacteria group bacterium]|jgi:tRNA (guanine10-N2)-dimethyltransferase